MSGTGSPADRTATADPSARFECGICWSVYDPGVGDEVWQVAPGTPFNALPPHWTCPNCAAEKPGFMVLDD